MLCHEFGAAQANASGGSCYQGLLACKSHSVVSRFADNDGDVPGWQVCAGRAKKLSRNTV
jgi:hypothetical protein